MGLDRWPEAARRRGFVAPEIHAAGREERVVQDQPSEGADADRGGRDAAGRARGGRARETGWTLGRGLRPAEPRDGAGRPSGGAREESTGGGLLPDAG